MNEIIDTIIGEANIAFNKNEVPVGCCIVKGNQIITKNHNIKNETNDSTNHAEILCIKEASNKMNNWRLIDCDLYVTLYPCPMCMSAIRQARIRNLYYLEDNLNKEYQNIGKEIATINDINPPINIVKINNTEYNNLLTNFYSKKR